MKLNLVEGKLSGERHIGHHPGAPHVQRAVEASPLEYVRVKNLNAGQAALCQPACIFVMIMSSDRSLNGQTVLKDRCSLPEQPNEFYCLKLINVEREMDVLFRKEKAERASRE